MFKISGFYYKIDSKYDLYIRVETEFGSENHDLHFLYITLTTVDAL